MKMKYFLRGFGTGLVTATVILFVIYAYKMSDTRIISRAKELGMVYGQKETETVLKDDSQKESEKEEKTSEENSGSASEQNTLQGENSSEVSGAGQTSTGESTDEQNSEIVTQTSETSSVITFSVIRGMSSVEVAEKLEKIGVIDDADSFDQYLMSHNMATILQNGEYELHTGMSYEEVADLMIK